MNLNKKEIENLLSEALDNTKTQTQTNKFNAESIYDLISTNRLLNNRITYLEQKVERYKRAYNRIYWENEERQQQETKAAELEKNLKNHFNTERTDN